MATSTNPLKAAMNGMKPKQSVPRIVKAEPAASKDKQGADLAPSRIGKKANTGHFEPLASATTKIACGGIRSLNPIFLGRSHQRSGSQTWQEPVGVSFDLT